MKSKSFGFYRENLYKTTSLTLLVCVGQTWVLFCLLYSSDNIHITKCVWTTLLSLLLTTEDSCLGSSAYAGSIHASAIYWIIRESSAKLPGKLCQFANQTKTRDQTQIRRTHWFKTIWTWEKFCVCPFTYAMNHRAPFPTAQQIRGVCSRRLPVAIITSVYMHSKGRNSTITTKEIRHAHNWNTKQLQYDYTYDRKWVK